MEGCDCCNIRDGGGCGFQAKKFVVEMKGGWMLNHAAGEKTYLGRLVLHTKEHRTDFDKLNELEAQTLGTNIQRIIYYLRQYWTKSYTNDPIEIVHVAYLNETPHILRHIFLLSEEQSLKKSHVHLHLLQRTKEMGEALGYCADKIGWSLLDTIDKFPPRYKIHSIYNEEAQDLMRYLQVSLYEKEGGPITNHD